MEKEEKDVVEETQEGEGAEEESNEQSEPSSDSEESTPSPIGVIIIVILLVVAALLGYMVVVSTETEDVDMPMDDNPSEEVVDDPEEPVVDDPVEEEPAVVDEVAAPVQGDPVAAQSDANRLSEIVPTPEEEIDQGLVASAELLAVTEVREGTAINVTNCAPSPRAITANTDDVLAIENNGSAAITLTFEDGTKHVAPPGASSFTIALYEGPNMYTCGSGGEAEGVIFVNP